MGALAAASAIDIRALGTGALLPAALVGAGLARGLRPHLDAGRVRPAVLGVAAVSAVVLLVRTRV